MKKAIFLISAVVPAYNEEKTIAKVVRTLSRHPLVGEVIVVDDGSSDNTAKIAQNNGAKVIRNEDNFGKGQSMDRGIKESYYPYVFFCDADVIGLNEKILDRIFYPVLSRDCDMYVGLRDRNTWWLNRFLYVFPIIGGERIIKKTLWYKVPKKYRKSFQIEIALNFAAKRFGKGMWFELMPGVTQIKKEKKYGFRSGFKSRILMMKDIIVISIRIYLGGLLQKINFNKYLINFVSQKRNT